MGRRIAGGLRIALVTVGCLLCLPRAAVAVDSSAYARFFGDFEGTAISDTRGEIGKRDISVSIGPYESGFYVQWVSTTYKASGRQKKKEYAISFEPSSRAGIYRSAMRKNMFGQIVPMDPMKGDPYVWATIEEDTLTVFALHITEDGGYEMQTYIRTLVEDGMSLEFSRIRNGEPLRTVTGKLERVR